MNTQFSSYVKYAGVLLCSVLLLFACSKDDGPGKQPDPIEEGQLILEISATEIDEGDEVTFSVTLDGKTIDADIYIDDAKIEGSTHTFDKIGMHQVIARKEGYMESKTGEVKVYRVDVYVAGGEESGSRFIPKYWKNGEPIELASINRDAIAGSIFVSEDVVHVAGTEFNDDNSQQIIKYWRDGSPTVLSSNGVGNMEIDLVSLFVSENDVYVSAAEIENGVYVAKYWKNGEPTALSDGTKQVYSSSIFVSGKDVYVAGIEGSGGKNIAKYWKNGTPVELTDGTSSPMSLSIYVSEEEVYASGMVFNEPNKNNPIVKYWGNGEVVDLTDGNQYAGALSIGMKGKDVYVVGFEGNVAKYWKNGQAVNLTDGTQYGMATSVFIDKEDVYIAGTDGVTALYWKNGEEVRLSDGSQHAYVTSIFVARTLGE